MNTILALATQSPWNHFRSYAVLAVVFWIIAIALSFIPKSKQRSTLQGALAIAGSFALGMFAFVLWRALERPPLRTLGETRLWYAIFTPTIGAVAHMVFRQRWLLVYAIGMGILFLGINLAHPETYNKALMPALQSVWFVPHVLVYIFAYALFAGSSAIAVQGIWRSCKSKPDTTTDADALGLDLANRLVYFGFGFLSLGLLFGALWAKEAWGHYWTWDPKETWALLTWLGYLAYIHIRYRHPEARRAALWILALSFVILLTCWFGVNYMPSASQSVHTYTQ